jgi:hypothetical protein
MAKRKTATRTISNAGRLRMLRVVAATKAIGLAPTESSVEADGVVDMEFDRDILTFQVQPQTFELVFDGQQRKYTPDAKYVRPTGVIGFREFKDSSTLLNPEEMSKLDAAARQLARDGYEFAVVDSDQLRRGYRMANIRLLKRYAQWPVSEPLRRQVRDAVRAPGRHVLGDLRDVVGPASLGSLYRMLWDQSIGVDLVGAPLSSASPVWSVESQGAHS